MKAKEPKRYHLIPNFYLKEFADSGRIQVQELGGKTYSCKTTNAFVVNNFYTIELEEHGRSLEFEYSLGDIERTASKSLRKLREHRGIDLSDKARISEFLLAQWVRGEDFRLSSKSFINLAIRDMARQSSEEDVRLFHELSYGRLVTDEEWQELWGALYQRQWDRTPVW